MSRSHRGAAAIRIVKSGVTEAQLRTRLAAGAKTPSTRNRQSWECIHVTVRQRVDQIADLKYEYNRKFPPGPGESQKEVEERALNQKTWFKNASVVAVCPQGGDVASAWLAVENISLTAVADGLGSGLIGFGGEEEKAVERLRGLPAGYELVGVLKLGVPEGPVPKPAMRPEFSRRHTNTF